VLKALIFDVDGTLSDTDPVHREAFAAFLEPHGITVTDEVYLARISGRTNAAIFADLFPGRDSAELDRFAEEKEALFRRMAPELPPLAGLLDLLAWAQERALKLAVVTNGPRINLEHAMEGLAVRDFFEVLLAREDVTHGKPDPMPYLTALDRLGTEASEAIVFEDSPSGIRSAKGAGIFTFGLLTGQPVSTLLEAGADATIADFRDPALWAKLEEAKRPGGG
jgi:HAD superfamily hydrolase (TIGR01509 family)